jgi:two-component system sensor histidine kinase DegS
MLDELYVNLKEMYNGFFKEQQELQDMLENNKNRIAQIDDYLHENDADFWRAEKLNIENDNQYYYEKLNILSDRIKILGNELNLLNRSSVSKKDKSGVDSYKRVRCNQQNIGEQRQILDIQEKERQRIARDLHDTSLQNLALLVHKIELTSMYMDQDIIKAKLELASVNKSLKSVIQDIRNTIFDLRPMIFDDLGLKNAFEKLIYKFRESSNCDIKFEVDEIECGNSLVLMTIYRIVEECVNNALKHSEGDKVIFTLKNEKGGCSIEVKDNGQSFDCNEVLSPEERHFGLYILRERVELLSGSIDIDSKPGVGTAIHIFIPLLEM